MCCCIGQISTGDVGIVERFGKFSRIQEPGCFCLGFPCEYLAGKQSLRIQQIDCSLETKTKDNVFVNVKVAVQFQVMKDRIYQAHYVLENPEQQMRAYVFDTVRSELTLMVLDEAFASKEEISNKIKHQLADVMGTFGITIMNTLITDLSPDARVREAMNEINAAKRQKQAAYQKAEGEKNIKVKAAEANMESMYLSGAGVAKQRKAIMNGLKESIVEFSAEVGETTPKDVMDLLVLNQYFDTLEHMGQNRNMKCVFLSSDSSAIRSGLLEADAAKTR
jgi:regulator of protease activity HflC (stomatin/prohibitin superfamily)